MINFEFETKTIIAALKLADGLGLRKDNLA